MLKEIFLKKLNTDSKTVNNAIITLGDTDDSGKGRHFKSRFIQPGLAGYPGQYGNALIRKENLDKFVHTLRNKPVIINHKDKINDDDKVGEVLNVWFNPDDGWYWCDGVITDKTAQNLIQNKKWSVSCSYDFTKYDDEGGTENNIPYDIEFLDGEFAHLAIVDNPRYERANIVFNSKADVNNDKWVTIKPNGEEHKGRHLLIKDGENVYDAMRRQWGVDVKGQQHLFDRNKYKTDKSYKDELYGKLQEHLKTVQKRYDNLEYLGVAEPDKLKDGDYEDISFEEWEEKQKDKEDKKETYYEDDMEESYTDSYADSISKDFDEFMKSKKEEPKSDLDTKREAYEATVKKMNDASKRKWNPKDNADWYAAVKEESEAKKALTDLRRDYAESIMSNFEEVEDNPYDDKIAQKQLRYQELSEKANTDSDRLSKQSHDMISAIPMGQPILVGHHSEGRDRRYRQRAWDKMDKAYELSKKADYYAEKAKSVGKSGISADDKNAIKKLSDKYNSIKKSHQRMLDANKIIKSKSSDEEKLKKLIDAGWSEENATKLITPSKWSGSVGFQSYELTSNTAEMRRIIDRVIDIHSRSLKAVGSSADTNTDYSDYGFEVERNTDINRLQLKFPGKPDANVRDILKSNGFRWSPKEGAWQRQLTGNAEYSLKRVMEKLKANNSKEQDMALIEELKKLITKVENDKGDNMINNEKEDKRKLIDEVGGILKGKVDDEIIRTIIKKMEEASYNESEAGSADNKKVKNEADEEDEKVENKKVKNEDEEEKEEDKKEVKELKEDEKKDVENKCNNAKETFFDKMNKIYNSSVAQPKQESYSSRADRLKAGEDYFKV